MEEQESRGNLIEIVWGAFLLFIGIVLLLQVTGFLEWRIWGTLWKFWPALIILIGISLFLPRRYPWLAALLSLVVLGACLGISAWQYTPSLAHDVTIIEQRYTYPADGIERVDTRIDFDAGSIVINELSNDQDLLLEIDDGHELQGNSQDHFSTMETHISREDGTVRVDVESMDRGELDKWLVRWHLSFNPQVPVALDLRCDGARVNLALEELDIERLNLTMNVSTGWLTLPSAAGDSTIDIDMDVSNLEIEVPEDVGVKIKADINLGMFTIDNERFLKQGDYYISSNYDNAVNRVELNILCDIGRVVIK